MTQKFGVFVILLALLLAGPEAARAQLVFTLEPTTQSTTPGSTVTFSAVLENTGASTLFLNGTDFGFFGSSTGITIDDSKFFTNFPSQLSAGQRTSLNQIFDVMVASSTANSSYAGFFSIVGGDNASAQNTLSTQNFQLNVVPEPSTALLLGMGSLGALAMKRRRRKSRLPEG